jgi:hypothetical protein
MIVLFKKDGMLYAKVLMDLRLPIPHKNRVFGKGKQELLLLPEEVEAILMRNGNMQIWNGKKYVKLGLGQFHDLVVRNKYTIEEVVKPKEVPKPKVVEEPKPVEVPVVEEVVKEEPKKEQPQQPKKEEYKQNENKKQRHNNNKQQNQGGDK